VSSASLGEDGGGSNSISSHSRTRKGSPKPDEEKERELKASKGGNYGFRPPERSKSGRKEVGVGTIVEMKLLS